MTSEGYDSAMLRVLYQEQERELAMSKHSTKQEDITVYNPAMTEIQPGAKIGSGSKIGSFTLIHSRAVIGKNCTIGSHCNICDDVVLGDNVSIQTGCHITRGVTIGECTFVGPNVTTMNNKYIEHPAREEEIPPKIGSRVRIGGGSCLLPGIVIGDDVLIGSGSVVTRDISSGSTAYGNPAKCKSQS